MRIAHISYHGCIRAHKMAWEQCRIGWQVHFMAYQLAPTHSWNTYSSVNLFNPETIDNKLDVRQLQNAVRILEPHVDLFHVHNEPNWLLKPVKQATSKPVVFDIHDWTSLRKATEVNAFDLEEEKYALEHADGFCVPSKGYLNKIDGITTKPTVHVYSKVGSWLFPSPPKEKLGGFVFEGGVSTGKDDTYNYPYRNWADVAKELAEEQDVYLYSANPGPFDIYKHDRIKVFPPHDYPSLLNAMSQHSVGIVGSPYPLDDFIDSMPNKLFEYVAAGIPMVVFNSSEASRFVEENKLGYSVSNAKEALEAYKELAFDRSVEKKRWELAMEAEIPKLMGFYKEVLEEWKDKLTPPSQAGLTDQAGVKEE